MTLPKPEFILNRLNHSSFRSRFTLKEKELSYFQQQGMEKIISHGKDFITQRLAPAEPKNDGKQTPWKGHPIFIAQHATATCCRGCLEKWYKIPKKQPLTQEEQTYILSVIQAWLTQDLQKHQ
ncbi:DUF4186 domain-containing protein [Commensalibacter papalotli (ex Botero et al. 2024)]|uniref:DUF4186 domain-containing protein n=1 Tax=Commensalibacter papalotli (ex Botero et al. 2024) TaxID=2972766 RepID=A0ABM9HL66_9PROT|nr:DUF4186 domain-containing protein [Commensalibacter papalotli (ex Botero et al. 2024)]CAI3933174.1 unnamed protein product [Commensalibacter papalotli (ex Botero et al. 2024)]CAI3949181.1 unnamed protein product [Commensalibacter papalotli (ex Botero et al. 2024)]